MRSTIILLAALLVGLSGLTVRALVDVDSREASPYGSPDERFASPSEASTRDPYAIERLCLSLPAKAGRQVAAANGADLQKALDSAAAGETIVLTPGRTYRPPEGKSFVLRNRPLAADQWIVIRSADKAFDPGGPLRPGVRVGESDAAHMPRLRSVSANVPAITTENGAHGYWFIGLDVGPDDSLRQLTNLIELGSGRDTSPDTEPHDIVIDRSFVHGNDDGNFRRGVLMNGRRLAVVDSYVANFHDANGDSQAIAGWNGPGPFKIVGNYLEAAGENIMFGGADPAIPDLVPSDIEIRGNLSTKRLAWRDARVPVKNAFELKAARRVLVDGNTFEHVWRSGQDGTAILLKSANQNGRCTGCVTEYVTFRNNIVRGAANGLSVNGAEAGRQGLPLPKTANHIRIDNVLFDDIGGPEWGGGGKLFKIMNGASDVAITHVTSRSNPAGILDAARASDLDPHLTFTDNVVERVKYGIGTGGNEGARTLERNFSPFTYARNVIVNRSSGSSQAISDSALAARYPKGTSVVGDWSEIHDKRIGADVDAITAAQSVRGVEGCGT
jgi:hypothetical protein